jgi:hypothetical protein
MNTPLRETAASAESGELLPPKLRPARLEDYQTIARLALVYSLDVPPYEDWSTLWLDNPLRTRSGKDFPIGWVLELPGGEMVGTMGTVRLRYTFRGDDLISAASRAWFVTDPYRGFALQLMDEYLNQSGVDLFINSAVSVPALEMFSRFCERIPLGEWDSISYWMTGCPPGPALWSQDAVRNKPLPKMPGSFTVESTDRFDSEFDVFWDELVRQNPEKLIAERSSKALSWHFGAPMRKGRLWILTASRNGKLRAYCTLTRQDHGFRLPALPHGDTQGLRGMRLADYQSLEPEVDFLPAFLAAALQRCAAEDLFILENLGRGVPKMRVVDECAPYRKKLENWKFFYSAAEPTLEADLGESRFWDPSAYDGDATFE